MMWIRTVVVLAHIVGALAVGVVAASWGAPRLAGVLVVGVIPLMSGVLHLVERRIGGDIWSFDAPYPYRWMLAATDERVETYSRRTDDVKRSEASVVDPWESRAAA